MCARVCRSGRGRVACRLWLLERGAREFGFALDHAQLVHTQWFHIARCRAEVFVKRVGTNDISVWGQGYNSADLPSRREFGILRDSGAQEVKASLELGYQGDEWEVLQERWRLGRPAPPVG